MSFGTAEERWFSEGDALERGRAAADYEQEIRRLRSELERALAGQGELATRLEAAIESVGAVVQERNRLRRRCRMVSAAAADAAAFFVQLQAAATEEDAIDIAFGSCAETVSRRVAAAVEAA